MGRYEDIINLPHHVSRKHPKMSIYARSAQFAPFAALVGYSEAIYEEGRLTTDKVIIDDEQKNILDIKLQILNSNINRKMEVEFEYFVPDEKKNGGKYVNKVGIIRKIDFNYRKIIFEDKTDLKIDNIINITCDIFNKIY